MKADVRLLPSAHSDLESIYRFVAKDDVLAADRLFERLDGCCHALADFPRRGAARLELGKGLHSWSVGRYIIFYRLLENVVTVIRVVHGARDLSKLDFSAS